MPSGVAPPLLEITEDADDLGLSLGDDDDDGPMRIDCGTSIEKDSPRPSCASRRKKNLFRGSDAVVEIT